MRDDCPAQSLVDQTIQNQGQGQGQGQTMHFQSAAGTTPSPPRMYRIVYILFQSNSRSTSIVEVFADVQDANDECLRQAYSQGVTLTSKSSTWGPDSHSYCPVEPLRWDTPEGLSCWVESFDVVPKKIQSPALN